MWKLLSGLMADHIAQHLNENNLLAYEQKGARQGCIGTKDQLAMDRTISLDSKVRKTNHFMAWIDYQKAYDSVPHSWILETLKILKICLMVTRLIETSMST